MQSKLNICQILKVAVTAKNPDSATSKREELLPWLNFTGGWITVVATVVVTYALGFALSDKNNPLISVLASMGLIILFSEMFIKKRNDSFANVVYPFVFGALTILATSMSLGKTMVPNTALMAISALAWSAGGILFWERYKTPSAVAQVTTGLFAAAAIPLSYGGGEWPKVVLVLLFGCSHIWLGRQFDRLDPEREQIYSKVAYWFHSKGALGTFLGLTWLTGITGPLLNKSLVHPSYVASAGAAYLSQGILAALGLAGIWLSLKWNRKYYLVMGSMGLLVTSLTLGAGLGGVFLILGTVIGLLYNWDSLVSRLNPSEPAQALDS